MQRYADPDSDTNRKAWCGPNDGGIKRGDRADTGDNQARPTQGTGPEGSTYEDGESAALTADPSSLGANDGATSTPNVDIDDPTADSLNDASIDTLTIHGKDDPTLGLTNVNGVPPEDWAANTGETQVPEGENPIAWKPEDPELKPRRKRA